MLKSVKNAVRAVRWLELGGPLRSSKMVQWLWGWREGRTSLVSTKPMDAMGNPPGSAVDRNGEVAEVWQTSAELR